MQKKMMLIPAAVTAAAAMAMAAGQQGTGQPRDQVRPGTETRQPASRDARTMEKKDLTEDFIEGATRTNLFEIRVAELVSENVDDPEVQRFAQMMIQDHQRANQRLEQLGQQLDVDVPDDLYDWQDEMVDHMEEVDKSMLAAKFVIHQAGAHYSNILTHEYVANTASDQQVAAAAREMVPVLRRHFEQAQRLAERYAGSGVNDRGERGGGGVDRQRRPGSGTGTGTGDGMDETDDRGTGTRDENPSRRER